MPPSSADILERSGIPAEVISEDATPGRIDALWPGADWLVDGLLGTGLTRPVEGLLARAIASMNRSGRPILALDLPSGLDADAGKPLGDAIRARGHRDLRRSQARLRRRGGPGLYRRGRRGRHRRAPSPPLRKKD